MDYQVATANPEVEFDCRREKEQLLLLLTKHLVFFMFKGALFQSSRFFIFFLDNKKGLQRYWKLLEGHYKEIAKIPIHFLCLQMWSCTLSIEVEWSNFP